MGSSPSRLAQTLLDAPILLTIECCKAAVLVETGSKLFFLRGGVGGVGGREAGFPRSREPDHLDKSNSVLEIPDMGDQYQTLLIPHIILLWPLVLYFLVHYKEVNALLICFPQR